MWGIKFKSKTDPDTISEKTVEFLQDKEKCEKLMKAIDEDQHNNGRSKILYIDKEHILKRVG